MTFLNPHQSTFCLHRVPYFLDALAALGSILESERLSFMRLYQPYYTILYQFASTVPLDLVKIVKIVNIVNIAKIVNIANFVNISLLSILSRLPELSALSSIVNIVNSVSTLIHLLCQCFDIFFTIVAIMKSLLCSFQ